MPDARTFRSPLAIALGPTLGPLGVGSRDPTIRIRGAHAWRAFTTPDGPTTLHVHVTAPEVSAQAWGPGASWALDHAPAMVGAEDSLDAFTPDLHATVAKAHRRLPGHRIARTGQVADVLVQTIWNLAGEPRADDPRMLELLEPFRPHRGRVLRLLELEGQHAPTWGPRTEARDISRF